MRASRPTLLVGIVGATLGLLVYIVGLPLLINFSARAFTDSTGVFTVYMDPAGSNGNDGLAPSRGVQTLERVEEILENRRPRTDIEVRIKPGTYIAGETTWDFYVPGHTISFLPLGYQHGDASNEIGTRPRFLGEPTDGWWFHGVLPTGHPGGDTGLHFYFLEVSGYSYGGVKLSGGIKSLNGMRVPASRGANKNVFREMHFSRLGNAHAGEYYGFGAIDLVNSSDNKVLGNIFSEIENSHHERYIHGVYVAHHSSNNLIQENKFFRISGDAIRTRNSSNNNYISQNTFALTGSYAYSEWFCDEPATCSGKLECASRNNVFHDNVLVSNYVNDDLPAFQLVPPGMGQTGRGATCRNEGKPRARVWGNASV